MRTTNIVKKTYSASKNTIVVPKHFRDKDGKSRSMGYQAEQAFKKICLKNNYQWKNATKTENCTRHTDCHVTKPDGITFSVDVKMGLLKAVLPLNIEFIVVTSPTLIDDTS